MKKINKKWIVLLEAMIALTVGIFIVGFLAFISIDLNKMNNTANWNITMLQIEKYKNQLNFLKNRLVSKWQLITQYENNPYYGWDKLEVATNWKSLDDLNWYYILTNSNSCDSEINICLEEIWVDDFSNSVLLWGSILYEDDASWKITIKENFTSFYNEDTCDEENTDCIKYRFFIENLTNINYEPLQYKEIDWNIKTLNDKKLITIEMKDWQNEEVKKFNYILSLY